MFSKTLSQTSYSLTFPVGHENCCKLAHEISSSCTLKGKPPCSGTLRTEVEGASDGTTTVSGFCTILRTVVSFVLLQWLANGPDCQLGDRRRHLWSSTALRLIVILCRTSTSVNLWNSKICPRSIWQGMKHDLSCSPTSSKVRCRITRWLVSSVNQQR